MKNRILYIQIISIIVLLYGSYEFLKVNRLNYDNWIGPYLSAAVNLEFGGSFQIDIDEILRWKTFRVEDQDSYKFVGNEKLSRYNHNPIGYAYIIKFATSIFPFFGHQKSILLLQCLLHVLISLLFLSLKEFSVRQKWLFFILYSINPFVLRWAPMNYYYFWQVIPSVIFVYTMVSRSPKRLIVSILMLVLPFVLLTRLTIVATLPFVFYVLFKKTSFKFSTIWLVYGISIFFLLYQPTKKNIWHTVYVGFAAFENEYNKTIFDENAYDLYEKEFGEKLIANVGGNYYQDEVIDRYKEVTKKISIRIIKDNPVMVIKNAIVNTLEGYSIGFINRGDWLNYFIALSGLIFIILLLKYKMYIWFLMIGFSIGTFTLYYPAQGSYIYGAYLVSVGAFINLPFINKIIQKHNSISN